MITFYPSGNFVGYALVTLKRNQPFGSSNPIEWDRFLNLFGGPIFGLSPLESDFGTQLNQLGQNKLPLGLEGKADDLFELYVRNAFEFIFGCKVIRYGQDRRFETRPDGIILQSGANSG